MRRFFSRNVREYNAVSLVQIIYDIMNEFQQSNDDYFTVTLVLMSEEVQEFLPALFSTGKFFPECINYDGIECSDYDDEYIISLVNDGSLWVEKAWNEEHGTYININPDINDIILASRRISDDYFDFINDGENYITSFEIED